MFREYSISTIQIQKNPTSAAPILPMCSLYTISSISYVLSEDRLTCPLPVRIPPLISMSSHTISPTLVQSEYLVLCSCSQYRISPAHVLSVHYIPNYFQSEYHLYYQYLVSYLHICVNFTLNDHEKDCMLPSFNITSFSMEVLCYICPYQNNVIY